MLIWRWIALASAVLAFSGDVCAEGQSRTIVSCGTEKIRLIIQNHTGNPNRLSFEGAIQDDNLREKLSGLGQRTSHFAALACTQMARRDTTFFVLLAFVRQDAQTPILDERGRQVLMKTVLIKFVGNRPHSYLEVETARDDEGLTLLPEYGLLSKDYQTYLGHIMDVSDDPEFFREHAIVKIEPETIARDN